MTHSHEPDAHPVYHAGDDNPKPDGKPSRVNGVRQRETVALGYETVALAEPPRVFALYRPEQVEDRPEEGIAWWVLEVPGGSVYVLSATSGDHTLISSHSLERVERFWAPRVDADLVAVTGTPTNTAG